MGIREWWKNISCLKTCEECEHSEDVGWEDTILNCDIHDINFYPYDEDIKNNPARNCNDFITYDDGHINRDDGYDGKKYAGKILFVCCHGAISATSAMMYKKSYQTMYFATNTGTWMPIGDMVKWTQLIVFSQEWMFVMFKNLISSKIEDKSIILDIPDQYDYYQPELIEEITYKMGLYGYDP